jgi:hypothetical protein
MRSRTIEETAYISKRFMLKRYLGWTEDDIQMNEAMLKQERSIEDFTEFDEIQQIYDPAIYDSRKVKFEEPEMPQDMGGGLDMNPPGEAPVPPGPVGAPPEEGGEAENLPPAA